MKIERIYIGGWFQRTMLQLSEVYDFVRNGTSRLDLSKEKLKKLHDALEIKQIDYGCEGMEYIILTTISGVNIKIFEDGLIVLNDSKITEETMPQDINNLTNYYETKLSPALSYLFSLGAPIPKELANIETVYPYFIVLNNESKDNIKKLLDETDKQKYFEYNNDSYDVVRGDKYYFINNKHKKIDEVERYIEEQIFIREFKGQLHKYLNLHRIIWERIADVKENAKITGKKIVEFTNKLDGYAKTINLIDARINQMSTYLKTREKLAKNDEALTTALDQIGYRYETLGNTLSYMQQIWKMTKNYVDSAQSLFDGLQEEVTQKSLDSLTIVTSMGVGASLIGLFTESAPTFTAFGVLYFFILAIVGYSVNKIMKKVAEKRKYEVSDIEYDKNIK